MPESLGMKRQTALLTFVVALVLVTFNMNTAHAMGRGKPIDQTPTTPVVTPAPTTPAPTNPVAGASDATPLWESKVKGSRDWSNHVYSELDRLGQNLLDVIPADAATFCPNYKNLSYEDRKTYWVYIMSAMTKFESGFNVNASYTESFADSTGNKVVSRGLLQISIESSKGYDCGMTNAQELHDPYKNLSCGIRILDRWVGRDGRIGGKVDSKWRGGARYWSVLREGDKTSYKSIVAWSKALKICQ